MNKPGGKMTRTAFERQQLNASLARLGDPVRSFKRRIHEDIEREAKAKRRKK